MSGRLSKITDKKVLKANHLSTSQPAVFRKHQETVDF